MDQLDFLLIAGLLLAAALTASADSEPMGNGFYHHGVATPVSNHRARSPRSTVSVATSR